VTSLPGLRRVEQIMGMPIVVDVRDDGGETPFVEVFAWFRFVDELFSTYKATSEISRLNRGELALEQAHPDVREVLARCEQLRVDTDGFFDVHAASAEELDPSGYVKGWSVERAAAILGEFGAENFAVSAGGDMCLRGAALPEAVWRVGIQHPELPDRVAAVVEANDLAVATSGAYVRGDHVYDPHTHVAATGLLSVTITGPELAIADAFATAAFAMGAAAAEWLGRLRGYEAFAILADGAGLRTAGFPALAQ
jgi:thiamine biosynthesis lipoprotein